MLARALALALPHALTLTVAITEGALDATMATNRDHADAKQQLLGTEARRKINHTVLF